MAEVLFYTVAIAGVATIGGIFLAACRAPTFVWVFNIVVIFYLSIAGKGAIVLANLWLALLLSLFTLNHPWPGPFLHWLPLNHAQLWALTLLCLWTIGLALLFLLAFASDFLRSQGWKTWERFGSLGGLTLFILGIGRLLFYQWILKSF